MLDENLEVTGYCVVDYVHHYLEGDCIEELSYTMDTYAEAKRFKESEYEKRKHPSAFIICRIKERE